MKWEGAEWVGRLMEASGIGAAVIYWGWLTEHCNQQRRLSRRQRQADACYFMIKAHGTEPVLQAGAEQNMKWGRQNFHPNYGSSKDKCLFIFHTGNTNNNKKKNS